MKKNNIFIVVFTVLFVMYVALDFIAPEPVNWSVTYQVNDKNPFGGFILNDRSGDLFENGFDHSYNTLSELSESETNILILAEQADINRTDFDKLFEILDKGGSVFIGATTFSQKLADTLNFKIHTEYQLLDQNIFEAPLSTIKIFDSLEFSYPSNLVPGFFEIENGHGWDVMATLTGQPIGITKTVGKGRITLVSAPYIFTNFGMLINGNYPVVAALLSTLPAKGAHYTMFYQSGKGGRCGSGP